LLLSISITAAVGQTIAAGQTATKQARSVAQTVSEERDSPVRQIASTVQPFSAAPIGSSAQVTDDEQTKTPLTQNWKIAPKDSDDGVTATKRYPLLENPQAAGYQFYLCVGKNINGTSIALISKSDVKQCTPPSGDTGYGAIPTTLFATEASYRFTMSQIGPFLENMDKRVSALSDKVDVFQKSVNESLSKRFDSLPAELVQSDPIKKLKQDILEEVNNKIAAFKK